jgi:cytochrome c556
VSGRLTFRAPLLALGLLACEHGQTATRVDASTTGSSVAHVVPPQSAHQAADALDSRTPVPLLPAMAEHQKQNMRDHLLVVQEVTTAMATGDFAGAERSARRIASSKSMTKTCEHMGSQAPGFTEVALRFHSTADSLVEAARKRDQRAVLAALGHTLRACTSCHAAYKQQIVDAATWGSSSTPASPAHPH